MRNNDDLFSDLDNSFMGYEADTDRDDSYQNQNATNAPIHFPVEAAFAQLDGYSRALAAVPKCPENTLQLERVRSAALDLAASISSALAKEPVAAPHQPQRRRALQPSLLDHAHLEEFLSLGGDARRDALLSSLVADIEAAGDDLSCFAGTLSADMLGTIRRALALASTIGAERATRLARDLEDGLAQNDARKCAAVARLLQSDLTDLANLLKDMVQTANTQPAE